MMCKDCNEMGLCEYHMNQRALEMYARRLGVSPTIFLGYELRDDGVE